MPFEDGAVRGGGVSVAADLVIALRDVRFRYPKAVEDALLIESFKVAANERVFVRGPSGSGKTTLLSMLAGILVPTSGEACLHGQEWATLSAARRDRLRVDEIGYIFQQFNLLGHLSVLDNVLLPCRFSAARRSRAGESTEQITSTAQRLLASMGLDEGILRRRAAELSVGQQQRVAAARALIGRPSLVIADEPTSALDEGTRESFMDVLLTACEAARSALVFVSHDGRLAPRFDLEVDLASVNRARESSAGSPG